MRTPPTHLTSNIFRLMLSTADQLEASFMSTLPVRFTIGLIYGVQRDSGHFVRQPPADLKPVLFSAGVRGFFGVYKNGRKSDNCPS